MTANRFDDVIGAIDALFAEAVEPAPVRFSPNGLSDREIEDFIDAQLARGEFGTGPAVSTAVATPPATPRRSAPRRSSRRTSAAVEPRFNRYAAPCKFCGVTVEPMAGLLTRRGRAWVVTHTVCPSEVPTPAPAPRPRRSAAPAPVDEVEDFVGEDCYVVTVEVEVTGVRNPREAALLAIREVFTGEVTVTVSTPDGDAEEINVTI